MSKKSKPVIEALNPLLASVNVFARKLKHYHWNVKGRNFFTLHAKFEELYGQWSEFGDEIAERVVALGGSPLATLAEDLKQSSLKEDASSPDADVMVKRVIADLESLIVQAHEAIEAATKAEDSTTEDLLDDVADGAEGKLWMLQAYLG